MPALEFSVRLNGTDFEILSELKKIRGKSNAEIVRQAIRIVGDINRGETTLRTKEGAVIPITVIFS